MKAVVIFLIAALMLITASLSGCGRKTPPVYRETGKVNNIKGII